MESFSRSCAASRSDGCKGAETSGGKTTIPVTISNFDEGKAVFANVCVGGKGLFPFFIDTGSAGSEIDAKLAEELDLEKVGKAQVAGGAGCSFRTQPVRMPAWSVAVTVEGKEGKPIESLAEAAEGPLPMGLVTGTPKVVAPMVVQALPGSVTMRTPSARRRKSPASKVANGRSRASR